MCNGGKPSCFTKEYKLRLLSEFEKDLEDLGQFEWITIMQRGGQVPKSFGDLVMTKPGSKERLAVLMEIKASLSASGGDSGEVEKPIIIIIKCKVKELECHYLKIRETIAL